MRAKFQGPRLILATASILVFLCLSQSRAAELGGVTLPDQIRVEGKTLVLNGIGLRTHLLVKLSVGGLYLEKKSGDAAEIVSSDQMKRVVVHFITSRLPKQNLVDAWNIGFEANSGAQKPALKSRIDKFNGMMTDVHAGEELDVTYIPGVGTKIRLIGQDTGTIEGKDFADALFSLWIGPHPVHEGLKQGMLGKG